MRIYTTKEAAKTMGVCEETVRRWIRSGKLPAYQMSRTAGNRIFEDELFMFAMERASRKAPVLHTT